jgi:plastocyanin
MRVRVILVSLALVASPYAWIAPAVAAGPPLTITADMPAAIPAGHNWGFNDFFPRTLAVATGSTIQFAVEGFHTSTLLPAGMTAAQDLQAAGIFKPDPDDAALNPNGTIHTQLFAPGLFPTPAGCGTPANPCPFDGSSIVSGGNPLGPPSGPFVVKVTAAPGTYVFHCRVHPQMEGALTVLPADASGTTPAQLAAAVSTQVASDVQAGLVAEAHAQNATPRQNADGTKTWTMTAGTGSADGHVAVLEMLPRNIHIRSGDRVVWKPIEANEPHTVTFPGELNTDIVALCEAGNGDVPAVPNHLPPQSPGDFHCGAQPFPDEIEFGGGNGNANVSSPATVSDSGILAPAAEPEAFGVSGAATVHSWAVTFAGARPGVYHYICQIHEGMEGQITVVPGS